MNSNDDIDKALEATEKDLSSWLQTVLAEWPLYFIKNKERHHFFLELVFISPGHKGAAVHLPKATQISLHYRLTGYGVDADDCRQALTRAFILISQHKRYDISEHHQLDPEDKKPSLTFSVPLKVLHPVKTLPRVSSMPQLQSVGLAQLRGRILGPGGLAVANAVIEIETLSLRTRTCPKGLFVLDNLPMNSDQQLNITARNHQQTFLIKDIHSSKKTVELAFQFPSNERSI